jgi:hypothetical protein
MANLSELMSETAHQLGGTPMAVQPDNVNCAETDGSTLFYNTRFMSDLESAAGTDGVRFVIAHELGHQVGGMEVGGHSAEFMADDFATRALAQSGAQFSAIEKVFSFLGPGGSESHPTSSSRISRASAAFTNARDDFAGPTEIEKPQKSNMHEHDLAI